VHIHYINFYNDFKPIRSFPTIIIIINTGKTMTKDYDYAEGKIYTAADNFWTVL